MTVSTIATCAHRNADVEAEIGQLRAQLLHKDQENERVQLQLQEEKEERERAQRKVRPGSRSDLMMHASGDRPDTDYDTQPHGLSCRLRLPASYTQVRNLYNGSGVHFCSDAHWCSVYAM